MKRTPLQRHTPLARSAMPPRTTPLRRSSSRLAVRRPWVSPEERAARKVVGRRSGGLCEACAEFEAVHWHHRVNKGQGGPWSASNGMHICPACHLWIGDFPASAAVLGWHLEPWRDETGERLRDTTLDPLRRRGEWVEIGDDGSITPSQPPERAATVLRVATNGAAR